MQVSMLAQKVVNGLAAPTASIFGRRGRARLPEEGLRIANKRTIKVVNAIALRGISISPAIVAIAFSSLLRLAPAGEGVWPLRMKAHAEGIADIKDEGEVSCNITISSFSLIMLSLLSMVSRKKNNNKTSGRGVMVDAG